MACPLGTAPPRAWSLELSGRLQTLNSRAVCGGGVGPQPPQAEQRGSPGPLSPLRGVRRGWAQPREVAAPGRNPVCA